MHFAGARANYVHARGIARFCMKTIKPLFMPALYQESAAHGLVILRDGSSAAVRVARAVDATALANFFLRLSPESRRQRFFSESKPGMDMIASLCDDSQPRRQMTLLVSRLGDGKEHIIATGSYIAHNQDTAEFAVAVDDAFQGKGLGALLLERLSVLAVSHGFIHFMAITSPGNQPMLEVFRTSGFELKERFKDGVVEIDLSVIPREESVARSEMRDRLATTASLRPFFKPNAVAVVGASRSPGQMGNRIVSQLLANQFQGKVFAVNSAGGSIGALPAYTSMKELPGPVDLAILVVPKHAVLSVVDECAALGVKAALVISSGFAESDDAGRARQRELVGKIRGYGMRLIGPNCLGLINTDPAIRLNATFAPSFPQAGSIAISSQSGALGLAILELATRLNLGLSSFVSVGNKADVTGNDLLQYWEDDPRTNVILLYLESFGNPRRFARIARRVSHTKPIVCVKPSRTRTGSGPTKRLPTDEVATDALFQQTGVIRAETLEEMFELATALAQQPLPQGKRVGIITNAGGPAILCADACEAGGLEIAAITEDVREELKRFLPADATLGNPLDLTASATPEHFEKTIVHALQDSGLDALIVIYIPIEASAGSSVARAIARGVSAVRAAGCKGKPVLTVMMTEDSASLPIQAGIEVLPRYLFPESAARVLSKAVRYAQWRREPPAVYPDFDDVDPAQARAICQKALLERGDGWLDNDETRTVLAAFHLERPADRPFTSPPLETRISVTEDPLFGPLISFGLGGLYYELFDDVSLRITPLSVGDAKDMICSLKAYRLLKGHRGHPAVDVDALEELLLRTAALVEEVPEIRELEFNPVLALEPGKGSLVKSARLRVSAASNAQPTRYASA